MNKCVTPGCNRQLTVCNAMAGGQTRQSIFKWESDAALPEPGKLIAPSQLFQMLAGQPLAERIAGEYLRQQPKPWR